MAQGLNALSPMPRESTPRRTSLTVFLVLMFLFADLMLPQAVDYDIQLEEQHIVSLVSSVVSVEADTSIEEFNPTSNYNQSGSGYLGISDAGFESRLLFDFAMNFTSSDTVHSATLNIACDENSLSSSDISIYAATPSSWNSSTVTWAQSDTGSMWNTFGADGAGDRSAWEPPIPYYN